MQAQRISLKRSASGAFARQPEVQEAETRNSQSPTMSTLRTGGGPRVVPYQSQTSSPDMSNGHSYAGRDQYQYPTQGDLFRHIPQNLESSGLLNDYNDQGHPYFKEQMPSSPAANEAMRYRPDGQMDMVKYHNNTMSDFPPVQGFEMQVPPQNYPKQEDDLDQQALRAKRDAESKRKQIPPFVQKLSR